METQQQQGRHIQIPNRVEEVWESSPHLPLPQRLNAAFESISVSSFPQVPQNQVMEISSNASIAEAVQILARNNILSAPVRDAEASEDASWIDRYLGIVEFAGIILWLLHQSKPAASSGAVAATTGQGGNLLGVVASAAALSIPASGAVTSAVLAASTASALSSNADEISGKFFETLTASSFYQQTKVKDIAGSFRWAPFLPVQESDTLLTVLLLLSNYHMKSLPVVESGKAEIRNFITQSSVVHVLSSCDGLPWFDSIGKHTLAKLGFLATPTSKIIKIGENEPVLHAFELMQAHGIGGVPVVVGHSGNIPIGNISVRDVRFLLMLPHLYKSYRNITCKEFLDGTKVYLQKNDPSSPLLKAVVVCLATDTLKQVIFKLDEARIHRIYVVDSDGRLEGIVNLRDIISKFVDEPPGYFGDFFAGVVPVPRTSFP